MHFATRASSSSSSWRFAAPMMIAAHASASPAASWWRKSSKPAASAATGSRYDSSVNVLRAMRRESVYRISGTGSLAAFAAARITPRSKPALWAT